MTKHPKEAERLRKIVEAFPKITVTLLGDLVADEFVFGEISRVSREAPVLILKHRERTVLPGGGANAVNNLADLGVNVLPVGAIAVLRAFEVSRAGPDVWVTYLDPKQGPVRFRMSRQAGQGWQISEFDPEWVRRRAQEESVRIR